MKPLSASHRRAADATSVSSTVTRSKVERLMTLSTSAVADCVSNAPDHTLLSGWYGISPSYGLDILGRQPVFGGKMDELAIETEHPAESSLAEPRRARRDGVEYGLDVIRRTCNDAQHLRGRRLALQRLAEMLLCFGEFAGPLVELFLEVGGGETAMPRGRWRISGLTLRRLTAAFFHCCDAHRCASVARSPATAHRF